MVPTSAFQRFLDSRGLNNCFFYCFPKSDSYQLSVFAEFLSSLPDILDLAGGGKLRCLVWYSKKTSYGIFVIYKLLSMT